MKKKNILLLYATYGAGHKTIAHSIAEELTKRDPGAYEILTLDFLDYTNPFLSVSSNKIFEFMNTKASFLWETLYRITNTQQNYDKSVMLAKLYDNKKLKEVIVDFNPDIIISTHYYGSALISEYIRKDYINAKFITVVADFRAHSVWFRNSQYEDAIIVNDEEEKKYFSGKGIDPEKLKPFGIPVGDKFDNLEFDRKEELTKLGFIHDYPVLLFHGYGVAGSRQKRSMRYLRKILSANVKINIIFLAGRNTKTKRDAEKLKSIYKADNLVVLGYITYMHKLIPLCDLSASKAGTMTLRECLYCQKPIIIITETPGQEKDNTKYLEKYGCAKRIRTRFGFKNYLNKLVNNPNFLKQMIENIKNLSGKDSMNRLYDLIVDLLKNTN